MCVFECIYVCVCVCCVCVAVKVCGSVVAQLLPRPAFVYFMLFYDTTRGRGGGVPMGSKVWRQFTDSFAVLR
uniref:Putative secreted protein n=1 Tax=Anopheles darlingi TaxID=43151 RepID=A0A2M4D2D0_ANODA